MINFFNLLFLFNTNTFLYVLRQKWVCFTPSFDLQQMHAPVMLQRDFVVPSNQVTEKQIIIVTELKHHDNLSETLSLLTVAAVIIYSVSSGNMEVQRDERKSDMLQIVMCDINYYL